MVSIVQHSPATSRSGVHTGSTKHSPQSARQVSQDSNWSQNPSPHGQSPQSAAQLSQPSSMSHMPSPQGRHSPQSAAQVSQFSHPLHLPFPQSALTGAARTRNARPTPMNNEK